VVLSAVHPPALALWVDPKVHAAEVARVRGKIVAGPGDGDCSIWIGSIGADGYCQSTERANVAVSRWIDVDDLQAQAVVDQLLHRHRPGS
jgi:hypothetical protein